MKFLPTIYYAAKFLNILFNEFSNFVEEFVA